METPADTSRRHFLGLGAVAVGTVAVTAVEGLAAGPAVAADGDPVLLAATNQANNPTVIEIIDSGQPGLDVIARSDDGAVIGEIPRTTVTGCARTAAISVSTPWAGRPASIR